MPYQPDAERAVKTATTANSNAAATTVTTDWREQLPTISCTRMTLRELDLADAKSLLALLTTEEVSRFISPPPTTVEGFEKFILWTHGERKAGRYACFAVVPHEMTTAIGLFQVRQLEAGFASAEWGFALGSAFWGTGMFAEGALQVVNFALETLGVSRLEARACVANGRGNGALRKIGAVQEGVLRRSFFKDGRHHDQILWSILAEEWREAKGVGSPSIIH